LRTCTVTELKQQSLTHHTPISVFNFLKRSKKNELLQGTEAAEIKINENSLKVNKGEDKML